MNYLSAFLNSKLLWASTSIGLPVLCYLRRQIQGYWYDRSATMVERDLSGKNVIITGGNSGLGLGTAIEFAKMNANIIITVRSDEKGKKAIQQIYKVS